MDKIGQWFSGGDVGLGNCAGLVEPTFAISALVYAFNESATFNVWEIDGSLSSSFLDGIESDGGAFKAGPIDISGIQDVGMNS